METLLLFVADRSVDVTVRCCSCAADDDMLVVVLLLELLLINWNGESG